MTVTVSWSPNSQPYATLPFEGRRSRVRSNKFATTELAVPICESTILERGVCVFVAVAAVLARYCTSEQVSVGVSKAGSSLALNVSTPADRKFCELAAGLRAVLSGLNIGPLDYERQVAESGPDAVEDRRALFGVLVQLDDEPTTLGQQDVTLNFDSSSGRLVASYDFRLLRSEVVEGFLRHVRRAIVAFKTDGAATIGDTQYVDNCEQANLRLLGSGGLPAFCGAMSDQLSAALLQWGEDSVVEVDDRCWTLTDLMRRADQIIKGLGSRIHKGARLGISLRPGADQISALLAAVRMDAIIVPLDTTLPTGRLAAIRADAALSAIVTEEALVAHFADADHLVIDALHAVPTDVPLWPHGAPTPSSPLYLLFTSGSTGRPKGVLVPHRTLANLVAWEDLQRPARGKRTLGRTSIAFDVGLQEVFATILFGGVLVIASESERADVGALANLLAKRRISKVYLPPVALHQMAEYAEASSVDGLDCLEHVIVAGEKLRISVAIRRFFRTMGAKLINQYGPTETHVATEAVLDPAPLRWPDIPSIGRPIAGVNVYVLDTTDTPAPILVPGELVIGGIAPALGYVVQSDDTQARFISDNHDGQLYRTGDRARWRPNGTLEFLGRLDDQVKVRGYRVELADLEINATYLSGVRYAAAKFWETEVWSGLALYVLLDSDKAPSHRELREALRERVPDYMLPPPPLVPCSSTFEAFP